ncbi:UNVERIFIED_CONTAM: hypothetical protein K2H54_018952 [Gekko kuhli]
MDIPEGKGYGLQTSLRHQLRGRVVWWRQKKTVEANAGRRRRAGGGAGGYGHPDVVTRQHVERFSSLAISHDSSQHLRRAKAADEGHVQVEGPWRCRVT